MTEMEKQRLKELLGESDEEEGDGDDNQGIPFATTVQEVHNYAVILFLIYACLSPIQFCRRERKKHFQCLDSATVRMI